MKKDFIKPLLKQEIHIITKARQDANLMYIRAGKKVAEADRNYMMVK